MPLDLGSTVKKTGSFVFGNKLLNKFLGSGLFLAGIIAITMILLVMIMYPAKSGSSFFIVFKMFLYMFGLSVILIFLHDSVLKFHIEEEKEQRDAEDILQNTTIAGRQNDVVYGGYPSISPQTNMGQTQIKPLSSNEGRPQFLQRSNVSELSVAEGYKGVLGGRQAPPPRTNIFGR
jgi:hypothetical protein